MLAWRTAPRSGTGGHRAMVGVLGKTPQEQSRNLLNHVVWGEKTTPNTCEEFQELEKAIWIISTPPEY